MSELARLQQQLQAYILEGDDDAVTELQFQQRASIYRNAFFLRMIQAMQQDYPVLLLALGETCFNEAVVSYVQIHQSHHYSLREVGREFPEYLASLATLTPDQIELAQLENLCLKVMYSISVDDLAINAITAKLSQHPSLKVFKEHYNTFARQQHALQHQETLPAQQHHKPKHYAIWCYHGETRFKQIDS